MDYRLLVDLEVITFIDDLPEKTRRQIASFFVQLRNSPDRFSELQEVDKSGRVTELAFVGAYAIGYWIDFPDRHVKVLEIRLADR